MAQTVQPTFKLERGANPLLRTAAFLSLAHAALWGLLLFRWMTFGAFDWNALPLELAFAEFAPLVAYLLFGGFAVVDLLVGLGLLREMETARRIGIGRSIVAIGLGVVYFLLAREFYGTAFLLGLAGMLLILQLRLSAWAIAFPSAFWLGVFFVAPMLIVLIVSFGDRARLGTVVYPPFELSNLGAYFDDYARFFTRINGEFLYLRIFGRSVGIATLNTLLCLLLGFPFAYWISRRNPRYRPILIFLVMIPFWTNFLVRTYAWMLILRDSGLINNFWTITLHEQAVMLADSSAFFAWLAGVTENKLNLLFTQGAVILGLLYGFFPLMVLPLYSNLERIDWSLLEAAADLGANGYQSMLRVLLPLTLPGIVAGSIIVFIPSLGAYVTPDLLGGAKVSLLGNLLQQQFMTTRNWPFGSAIGFTMMAIMLLAVLLYFRVAYDNPEVNV